MLTRLPGGLAVPPEAAAAVLASRFGEEPLQLAAAKRRTLLSTLAAAGVGGGASYDGLVALEAEAHEQILLTRDARAQDTYRRLGVAFRALGLTAPSYPSPPCPTPAAYPSACRSPARTPAAAPGSRPT